MRLSIQRQRRPGHTGSSAKLPLPESVGEHDDLVGAATNEFVFARQASLGRPSAERREKTRCHEDHRQPARLAAAGHVDAGAALTVEIAAEVFDLPPLRAPVVEIDRRHRRLRACWRVRFADQTA